MTTPSNFNARSDRAALALKAGMKDRNGQPLQQRSVPVDEDGQPARPLPPEGSYARQIIERQRAATAAARAEADPQSGAPPDEQPGTPNNGQPPSPSEPPADPQLTPNAQERFGRLTQTLRQKDQELQASLARQKEAERVAAEAARRAEAAEARLQTVTQQTLEHLSPEDRAAVLHETRLKEEVQGMEERIMGRIAPVLDGFQERAVQQDRSKLASKYARYDPETHDPLIAMFRERNPNCSIEQAFRAVAEPEELAVRSARAPAVPPIANPAPGNGPPRYVPNQQQQTSPEQEIEEDRQRAYQLARSTNARDRRHVGPAFDRLIRSKLGGNLPGNAPRR